MLRTFHGHVQFSSKFVSVHNTQTKCRAAGLACQFSRSGSSHRASVTSLSLVVMLSTETYDNVLVMKASEWAWLVVRSQSDLITAQIPRRWRTFFTHMHFTYTRTSRLEWQTFPQPQCLFTWNDTSLGFLVLTDSTDSRTQVTNRKQMIALEAARPAGSSHSIDLLDLRNPASWWRSY